MFIMNSTLWLALFTGSLLETDVSDDNNQITFWDYARFIFNSTHTTGDPFTDKITNINPAYLGVLLNAGSELAMTIAFSGPMIGIFFNFFNTVLLADVLGKAKPPFHFRS